MKKFSCRRGFKIDINDSETRTSVNCRTLDPKENIRMFLQCSNCGYGKRVHILESRFAPFTTREVRVCKMQLVE